MTNEPVNLEPSGGSPVTTINEQRANVVRIIPMGPFSTSALIIVKW